MSIRIPETINAYANGAANPPVSLVFPASAAAKAAGVGFIVGVFIDVPLQGFKSGTRNVLVRGNAGLSGHSAAIQITTTGQLAASFFASTQQIPTIAGNPIQLTLGKAYLVGLIATATKVYLFACEAKVGAVAGDVLTRAETTTYLSATAMNGTTGVNAPVFQAIGDYPSARSTTRTYYGAVENAFMVRGAFPEPSGTLDTTLLANLASGAQAIAGLAALMSGGAASFHYPMAKPTDLADALGIAGPIVPSDTDAVDRILYAGGPLRPGAMRPTRSIDVASQVLFGTRADPTTAFATIATVGGTYAGITPTRIEAQLEKRDGTVVRAWTVVDAAPSGGAWAPNLNAFTNVPMSADWDMLHFRAMNGGGQLAECYSHGLVGAGFHVLGEAQSQFLFLFTTHTAPAALPPGVRARVVQVRTGTSLENHMGPYDYIGAPLVYVARGVRQLIAEIHALFPGVPISFDTIGQASNPITQWLPPSGAFIDRSPRYKVLQGDAPQPFVMLAFGHSSGNDANYGTYLTTLLDLWASEIRPPLIELHCAVPRYLGGGSTDAFETVIGRTKARDVAATRTVRPQFWGSNGATVKTGNGGQPEVAGTTNPHPSGDDDGDGRSATYVAWAIMMAVDAVNSQPIGIVGATRVNSTTVDLVFGEINA